MAAILSTSRVSQALVGVAEESAGLEAAFPGASREDASLGLI